MNEEYLPSVLSATHGPLWRNPQPGIWSYDGEREDADRSRSILQTLMDQPRWLEAYHLYDERGSQLFERICELPEYYLTRTENELLSKHAGTIIDLASAECIAELGAGFSRKTMHLLREQDRQRRGGAFAPIDVSLTGLAASRDMIRNNFPELAFHGLQARFEHAIAGIERNLPTLFVFLGSTIGNFTRVEFIKFFQHLSSCMGPNDFLLLGVDCVKETELLETAYNDSRGITAEFILNVFLNINRIAQSNFDLEQMSYRSWYNGQWRQIEMFAATERPQEIRFPLRQCSFIWENDDPILVEISRKFEPKKLQQQLRCFDLEPVASFTDPRDWFALLLLRKSQSA
ncbi:MAG: L-histidine N(alpha)-methyltransferase [Candidatus Binatia bacterium]